MNHARLNHVQFIVGLGLVVLAALVILFVTRKRSSAGAMATRALDRIKLVNLRKSRAA